MKQLCFAIFGNSYQANKSSCIHELIALLEERNARLFIDSTFLNNNIDIINKINNYEIYNYGSKGTYNKDNIIITNNIINNKSNNKSIYCLFLTKDDISLNNCADSKMHSIIPSINGNYNNIKNNITNGSIILINNTKELPNIIDYINNKGYTITPLSNIIKE